MIMMISLVFYTKNKNETMNCKTYMCHIILLGKSEQNSVPGNISISKFLRKIGLMIYRLKVKEFVMFLFKILKKNHGLTT